MQVNWKVAGGVLIVVVAALVVQRLTRRVPLYQAAATRDLGAWGTVNRERALQLQSILDEGVNVLGVPGLQAFVVDSNGETWSGTSGTIDLGRREPLRRDHILRVGSVTKTFTAVMILKLVEAGSLKLEDPLARWFPELPNAETITIRQLLNHTSGIPEFLQNPQVLMKSIIPWTRWEPLELVDIAFKSGTPTKPGSEWGYSNSNYLLLGLIAEQVTGRTAAQLLREDVVEPLGLRNTYFIPFEAAPTTLVPGFDRDLSHFPGLLDIGTNNTSWATAAYTSGALASTAEDEGRFYQGLFNGKLLAPATMREMTTFVEASNPGFEAQNGYGLGLMRLEVGAQELRGHAGEFMGSTAMAMYSPEHRHIIVVNTNLSYPNLLEVVGRIQEVLQ